MKKEIEKKVPAKIENKEIVKKKRDQIIRAASELFAKKGYHSTSMRDISEASGINLAYLYHFVSSKDDILYLFYKSLYEDLDVIYQYLEDSTNEDPLEQIKNFIRLILEHLHKKNDEMLTMFTESRHLNRDSLYAILASESQHIKSVEKLISRGVQKGCFRTDSPHMASNMIQYFLLIEPLRRWSFRREYTFTRFSELVTDFILKALDVKEER